MYQYYPYFNPYYRNGISIPSKKTYINPLNGRKKLPLREVISNVEKGVDTISSFIPLYKKVEPVFKQGKNILTSITNLFNRNIKEPIQKEKVEVEIVNNTNKSYQYRNSESNSKPFFM